MPKMFVAMICMPEADREVWDQSLPPASVTNGWLFAVDEILDETFTFEALGQSQGRAIDRALAKRKAA